MKLKFQVNSMPWKLEKRSIDGNDVVIVTMNTNKANVFTEAFLKDMEHCLKELESDAYNQCGVVLTGQGSIFSAGLDLKSMPTLGPKALVDYISRFEHALVRVYQFPRPLVAAINGHAIAAGTCLIAACDQRVVVDNPRTKLGLNEIFMGIPLPCAATEICRFAFTNPTIWEMLLRGQFYSPKHGSSVGMVDEVCDKSELINRACKRAALSPLALKAYAEMKANLQGPTRLLLPQRLKETPPMLARAVKSMQLASRL